MARAFCGVTFAGYAAFDERFGDAALVVMSLGLAAFVAAITFVAVKMLSGYTVGVLAGDIPALLVLPSVLWIASGIEVADPTFGGSTGRFLLAATAVLCVQAIIGTVAAMLNTDDPERAAVGALGGTFAVIGVLGAGGRFAASDLPDGLSLAWMAVAMATLADGLVASRNRAAVRLASTIGFLLLVVVMSLAARAEMSSGGANRAIAMLAALAAVAVPSLAEAWSKAIALSVAGAPLRRETPGESMLRSAMSRLRRSGRG